jgi:hypothetical protein
MPPAGCTSPSELLNFDSRAVVNGNRIGQDGAEQVTAWN